MYLEEMMLRGFSWNHGVPFEKYSDFLGKILVAPKLYFQLLCQLIIDIKLCRVV